LIYVAAVRCVNGLGLPGDEFDCFLGEEVDDAKCRKFVMENIKIINITSYLHRLA